MASKADRTSRSAMNLSSWLTAAFLLLTLVGCLRGRDRHRPHLLRATTGRIYGACSHQRLMALARLLHRSLNVLRVDCAACHHVAHRRRRPLRLGLRPTARFSTSRRGVRCRGCGAKGQAVVSVKCGGAGAAKLWLLPSTRGTRAITGSRPIALTKGMEPKVRPVIARPERLSLDLPLSGRRATPGEPVVTSPCLSDNDDVMAH